MPDELITRDALNRIEATAHREIALLKELLETRLNEVDRRLGDLNNSHEKAVIEKKATDQAALQVQERSVTKAELQTWKDDVNRRLDTMAGAANARAAMLSISVGVLVLVVNLIIRYFTTP